MNVSLTPKLEQYINDLVESGMFSSASEVVRHALRQMQREDRILAASIERIRSDFNDGMKEAREGRAIDGPTAIAEIRAKLKNGGNTTSLQGGAHQTARPTRGKKKS